MGDAIIIFPHQLFKTHPALNSNKIIFIVEDSLFFGDIKYPFKFHKKKLVFHRASMQFYKDHLISKGYKVKYVNYIDISNQDKKLGSFKHLQFILDENEIKKIHIAEPVDWAIEKRLKKIANDAGFKMLFYDTPSFLVSKTSLKLFFSEKDNYLQTSFYIHQRKTLNILIDKKKPIGGKWSFDSQNRKKIPKDLSLPRIPSTKKNSYVKEAIEYIESTFPDNYGSIEDFSYPVTYKDALKWFEIFLKERFVNFGPYEDALIRGNSLLFHSLLSPLLNTGLLNPELVIKETLNYAELNQIPLNSLEGFIRQIIGWREFMRAIYELEGVNQRTSNYWNHENTIPESFYKGTTGILPIDEIIKRLLKTGYLHHIERLMVLSNFMVLCEIHPNEIYKWFMELFIDSYDWVMVPNVYGMSTYADGGLITTKPYVSSSNYVLKMSDYPKANWCEIWDGLFWRFISKNRKVFQSNPRMSLMVRILDKKDQKQLKDLLHKANNFLNNLYTNKAQSR
ncbi:MAG: cryptochrome/photolyase family protein [Candidatus Lokiarchaeota archaeon]|nr:cryptochrome/photolyase family protein [Candidatus Lokiarchaeota archaeon]MBD3202256.1 cryptochrome/photolyase family protein [Candidatus Lokiarchaeota archaeon]